MQASNDQLQQSTAWTDRQCSDEHLRELSLLIADWRELAPWLDLTTVDEQDIIGFPAPRPLSAQRITMLMTWKQMHGDQATYKRLLDVLTRCGRLDLVNKISELLKEERTISRSTGESMAMPRYM